MAFVSGFLALVSANLKHYSLAAFGFRLRLDPDYPIEFRFFPHLITDAVLEYRTYVLIVPWCIVLAWGCSHLPPFVLTALGLFWTVKSWQRAGCYKSGLAFWSQAYKESPRKDRVRTRYAEQLMMSIERDIKKNQNDWATQLKIIEAERVIEEICRP